MTKIIIIQPVYEELIYEEPIYEESMYDKERKMRNAFGFFKD